MCQRSQLWLFVLQTYSAALRLHREREREMEREGGRATVGIHPLNIHSLN